MNSVTKLSIRNYTFSHDRIDQIHSCEITVEHSFGLYYLLFLINIKCGDGGRISD